MMFGELVHDKVYECTEGFYKFKGFQNENVAVFQEITYDENDHEIILDDYVLKTKNDVRYLKW